MSAQTFDELLAERARMEPPLSSGVFVSVALHVLAAALIVVAPMLFPRELPRIPITGSFVAVQPGGRGVPDPAPPAPAKAETKPPVTAPPAPPVTAAPAKVMKPPVEKPKGLPDPDQKRRKTATPPPRTEPAREAGTGRAGGTTPDARGTTPEERGLVLAPPGPGVPSGTDAFGDWYLTSVQRKIWMIWSQQPQPPNHPPVHVEFTIMGDGSVTAFRVVTSSGDRGLDFSAQRAVMSAQPFSPLPRHYGTPTKTIQAIFRPL